MSAHSFVSIDNGDFDADQVKSLKEAAKFLGAGLYKVDRIDIYRRTTKSREGIAFDRILGIILFSWLSGAILFQTGFGIAISCVGAIALGAPILIGYVASVIKDLDDYAMVQVTKEGMVNVRCAYDGVQPWMIVHNMNERVQDRRSFIKRCENIYY